MTEDELYSAKIDAWTLCVLAMLREGVIDWDQASMAHRACPYLPHNRMENRLEVSA